MTDPHEAAALWGSAENAAYTAEERLACALRALEFYGADALAEDDPTPEERVDAAQRAADALDEALAGYGPEDWTDAARLLYRLRKVTATLSRLDASLVTWLYLHGEHGLHQQVEGIPGAVNITRGRAKERWEAEAAVRDYVEAQIVARDGEAPDPLEVVEWVLAVVPATPSTSLRKTPLRDAGLDVQDYYTSEPGSLSVGLPTHGT